MEKAGKLFRGLLKHVKFSLKNKVWEWPEDSDQVWGFFIFNEYQILSLIEGDRPRINGFKLNWVIQKNEFLNSEKYYVILVPFQAVTVESQFLDVFFKTRANKNCMLDGLNIWCRFF